MKSPVEVVKPRLTGAETAATKDEDLHVQAPAADLLFYARLTVDLAPVYSLLNAISLHHRCRPALPLSLFPVHLCLQAPPLGMFLPRLHHLPAPPLLNLLSRDHRVPT